MPLEVTGGYLDAPQFILKIQKAVQVTTYFVNNSISGPSNNVICQTLFSIVNIYIIFTDLIATQ